MSLIQDHLNQLRGSGLNDRTIEQAGITSLTNPAEAGRLLGWQGDGPAPAIRFPVFDMLRNIVTHYLRPDSPVERDGGSRPKYEVPRNQSLRLYFPPTIGEWNDHDKPLLITEGIKKALCVAQIGLPVIGGQGIWCFHDVATRERGTWRLHDDFAGIALRGRRIYLCFDGGDVDRNPHVILAEAQLARMLVEAGSAVHLIRIPSPSGQKVGIDDFLLFDPEARQLLDGLLHDALPGDPVERANVVTSSAEAIQVAQGLLRDLSFIAAVRVAGAAGLDGAFAFLRKAGVTKKALQERLEAFDSLFDQQKVQPAEKGDPPDIKAEAESLLRDPQLVERFLRDLALDGLVGEQVAAMVVLLSCISRKTSAPIHVVVKAASSSGKNFLVQTVVAQLPQSDVQMISDMSPKALQYLPTSLKGKVVVITEQVGAEQAEYPVRIMMSEGSITTLVAERVEDGGNSKIETRTHTLEGPAAFITTTTRGLLNDENETRVLELTLDESPEQTRRILTRQALNASEPSTREQEQATERRRAVWRCVHRLLTATRAIIPQAGALGESFPTSRVRSRRDFSKFLALTKAYALLHQHQREIRDGYVVATDEDVEAARNLCGALWSAVPPRLASIASRLTGAFKETTFTAADAAKILGYEVDAARKVLKDLERSDLTGLAETNRGSIAGRWRLVSADRGQASEGNRHAENEQPQLAMELA